MFLGAIAGIMLALGVFGVLVWQRFDQINSMFGAGQPSVDTSAASGSAASPEKVSAESRPVYRYSVIPGGVRTPEELIETMARDSAVADHYAGLDKAKLTSGRLTAPLQAHVSYRIGDRIYWTKQKVTVQAGEQVLTDGKKLVRGRCGNNISVAPLLPTLDNEPKPDVFDSIVSPLVPNSVVKLDPAHSYFTPEGLKTPQGAGAGMRSGPPVGGAFGPPVVGGGSPGTVSNPPSGNETPTGVPPGGNPPGNPPIGPPGPVPCPTLAATNSSDGHRPAAIPGCPGNPPGPPPGDPPIEIDPREIPDTPTPVPEPGTLVLIGGGVAVLLARRLRNKARD